MFIDWLVVFLYLFGVTLVSLENILALYTTAKNFSLK